ncbi:M4 family metallopeptidase [Mesobacillus subterraneus]
MYCSISKDHCPFSQAAKDLYGAASEEVNAVNKAFDAIGVN